MVRGPLWCMGGTLLSCAGVTWKSLWSWSSPGSRPMQGSEGTNCCSTSCPTRDWMENIDLLSEEAHSEMHLLRACCSLEAKGMQRQSLFPCHVEGSRSRKITLIQGSITCKILVPYTKPQCRLLPPLSATTEPANIKWSAVSTKVLTVPRWHLLLLLLQNVTSSLGVFPS